MQHLPWPSVRSTGSSYLLSAVRVCSATSTQPKSLWSAYKYIDRLAPKSQVQSRGALLTIGASVMLAASYWYMYMEMEGLEHRLNTTVAPSMRRQEDSPPPGSQREPWQAIKGDDSRASSSWYGRWTWRCSPGKRQKALRRLHSSPGATLPKSLFPDRIIWLQAFCFVQRNAIPSPLQGSRRLRGVLQPASAVKIDVLHKAKRLC
ncbi:uncharacterized protein TRIVIDRAFT_65389 [Trichoderma virens Gv29-8]|uniref:Uncharacterized protein n=1 Tax=Hypocrea virens (strain Gv29-8 / FGSC 10586) TaxID=413071 RepID=G9NAA6_HYPVG|nr:uncharacterized protein TRIVIDRAFT_65389 [Trichoderma virens Gv29-8]EHK16872.1 hypothetical protein TRIVIDRAFT_65389 [Trichoderma virens Gv29-8]UKZ51752.1 hypothetical protein TrVGV298_005516 [Trichoderma virens]